MARVINSYRIVTVLIPDEAASDMLFPRDDSMCNAARNRFY